MASTMAMAAPAEGMAMRLITLASARWKCLAAPAFLILLAAVPTLLLWQRINWADADSFHYMRSGVNLINGRGFLDMADKPMLMLDRPLYPLLIGLMNRVIPNVELSARLISLLASLLAVGSLYWLLAARYRFGVAFLATLLFALLPLRVWSAQWVLSESLSIGLTLFAFALLFRKDWPKRADALLAGVALGLAYLTRSEALWFALMLGLWVLLRLRRHSVRRHLSHALCLSVVALFAVGYHVWFHRETGRWNSLRLPIVFGYSASYYADRSEPWRFDPASGSIVLKPVDMSARAIVARYAFYLREEGERFSYLLGPSYVVIVLLFFGLTGFVLSFARPMNAGVAWQLISGSMLVLLPVFWVKDRFLLQVMPVGCFWLVQGSAELKNWLRAKTDGSRWKSLAVFPSAVLLTLVLLSYLVRLDTQIPKQSSVALAKRAATVAVSKRMAPGNVMSTDPSFPFYAGCVQVWMPDLKLPAEVLGYAQKANVRYLYVSSKDASSLSKGLLTEPEKLGLDLKLVATVSDGSDNARLFEFQNRYAAAR